MTVQVLPYRTFVIFCAGCWCRGNKGTGAPAHVHSDAINLAVTGTKVFFAIAINHMRHECSLALQRVLLDYVRLFMVALTILLSRWAAGMASGAAFGSSV